jgi:hypothetical protein
LAVDGEPAPAGKAAPAEKVAPADKPAPAGKGTPAAVPPATDAKPAADKDPATDACGKALDKLATGDATALNSLDEQRRQALMMHNAAADTVTCLAVAEKNEKFCDLLPKQQKENCTHQFKMLGSLKDASKDEFKAQAIFEACSQGKDVPACAIMRDAIASRDAGKCKELPKIAPAESPRADVEKYMALCAALATSDASKCKAITDEAEQGNCAAYASNDPERCPKESGDCRTMVKAFSIVAEKGLAGLGKIDATAVAAVKGREACVAPTAELKKRCAAH